tara:strand:- start:259 stop:438 length:180 start_codon:yes stop_codon:yes gene_type:complete
MWQILTGFAAGVYVGTYYDCKPTILLVQQMVKDKFPKERLDSASKKDKKKDDPPPKSWF